MKSIVNLLAALSFTLALEQTVSAQIARPIGTNLAGISDWSSEFVFVDVFKQCREWIPHGYGSGASWSSGVNIPLDTNGYPLEIPYNDGTNPPQTIRTLMYFGDLKQHYPGGNYRLMVSGNGQVSLWGAAAGTFSCPVDTFVWVDNSLGGIGLEIDTSIVSDPVRDIHFIMPGHENTFLTEPFNPELLDFINDYQNIRFMNWMKTNNSPVSNWSERNTPGYYSQTLKKGVAYEYIIKLCNQTQTDPWICIPHRATDQYIREMSRLLRDSLNPELKLYLEYSNEVWNGQFDQKHYADSMGNTLGYPGNSWGKGRKFYAKRMADIFNIFETEFEDDERLIKVIASQASNSGNSNNLIGYFNDPAYNPDQIKADAIAIAPYFGGAYSIEAGSSASINNIMVNNILDSMEVSLKKAFEWMNATKSVADSHDLKLIAYEGGQHLVAGSTYQNDTTYVNKLISANRHSGMEDLYCKYFNYWFDSTQADMFCHFTSHSVYTKFGSWGVKEYMDDYQSPKYAGMQNCVFSYNGNTSNNIKETPTQKAKISLYPNPFSEYTILKLPTDESHTLYIYDMSGKTVRTMANISTNKVTINKEDLTPGIYTTRLISARKTHEFKLVIK